MCALVTYGDGVVAPTEAACSDGVVQPGHGEVCDAGQGKYGTKCINEADFLPIVDTAAK